MKKLLRASWIVATGASYTISIAVVLAAIWTWPFALHLEDAYRVYQQSAQVWETLEPGHPSPVDMFAHLVDESGPVHVTSLQGIGETWQGYQAWLRFVATDEYIDSLIAEGFERAEWSALRHHFGLPLDYGQSFDPPWEPTASPKKECYRARVTNDWTHSGEHYLLIDRRTGTVYFVGVGA